MDTTTAAPPPRAWLADAIDPQTGELQSIRRGRSPVFASVLYQFQVELDAGPALGTNGNRIKKIKKADDRAATSIEQEAKRIMKRFVDRGWVRDEGIEVAVEIDTGLLAFSFFDLRAQTQVSGSIQVRS